MHLVHDTYETVGPHNCGPLLNGSVIKGPDWLHVNTLDYCTSNPKAGALDV